jgi:hypothetical protein
MRVVTAQLQPSTRTGPQSHATTLGLYVAIRCQALGVARKTPPSGDEWLRGRVDMRDLKRASPSPAGGSKGPGDEGGDRATATLNTHGTAVPCYDAGGYT